MEYQSKLRKAYFSGEEVPHNITRKNINFQWLLLFAKDSFYLINYLMIFLRLNKRLITSKQSKLFIKTFLKNGFKTKDSIKNYLFPQIKLSTILENSSFTKLEFLMLLKELIEEAIKDENDCRKILLHYYSLFRTENEKESISFCKLLITLRLSLFSEKTDPEIFESFCEMYMNNIIKDLYGSFASRCFYHFSAIHKILTEEKDQFYGYDVVIKIVKKFLLKFYCEKTIIPILTHLPVSNKDNLKLMINKLSPYNTMYLEILLLNEPNLSNKLDYRYDFLEKKLNIDDSYASKWIELAKNADIELIDVPRLKAIHENINWILYYIKQEYPNWKAYNQDPKEVNWNFPTLTHISSSEMRKYLKDSHCDKLHLSTQGYYEFFNLDLNWISKGIKKYKNEYYDYYVLKNVLIPNLEVVSNDKLNTFWAHKCLDEYKEDCNKAESCDLNKSVEENVERRHKIAKCYLKRDVYQHGSIAKPDLEKIKSHKEQIVNKENQLFDCNNILYDKKNN